MGNFMVWLLYSCGRNLGIHWRGNWVDSRAITDVVVKRRKEFISLNFCILLLV
jgi:hypothetical protein